MVGPTGASAAPLVREVPDRPGLGALAWAWSRPALAALVAATIGWWAIGLEPAGRWVASGFALAASARALSLLRTARTLTSGPGRYAFVLDSMVAGMSSQRWWRPTLSRSASTGRWVLLVEVDGTTAIGWVELGRFRWSWVADAEVVAVWGEVDQRCHLSLSGQFPTAMVIGSVRADPPRDLRLWRFGSSSGA